LPMIESPEQTVAYCRELLDRARVYAAIRP